MSRPETQREFVMLELAESSRRFANWIENTRHRAARELGLHVTDLRCLALIYDAKQPVSPKQIAEQLDLSTGSATAVIDRLEKAGVVSRVPNPDDRRGVLLVPNETAMQTAAPVHRWLQDYYSVSLSEFSVNELQSVCRFLDRIAGSDIAGAVRVLRDLKEEPKVDA